MEILIRSMPLFGQIILGGVVLLLGLVALQVVVWWCRNVLVHRLPKPFLGDDANMEWAETKRAELAQGRLSIDVRKRSGNGHPSNDPHSTAAAVRGNKPLLAHRTGFDDDHPALLMAWLTETRHIHDEWAEKLLARPDPANEGAE